MARRKKDGKRAMGIQGKKGYLYIVISEVKIINGEKKSEKKWISTGLIDAPENIEKATEMRQKILHQSEGSVIDRNISLAAYIDYVLSRKKRDVSDTTYSSYFYSGKRITEAIGSIKVKEINKNIIENFLDALFTTSNAQPRTVKDTKVFFSQIMESAVKEGLITSNPVKEVVINKNLIAQYSKPKKADDEFFSYDEALLFLKKTKEHELHELFYLTLFFGLRREEVLGLCWSAIDFTKKSMSIHHTVTKGTKVNRINRTKTSSSTRIYPLTDEQIDMFQRLKNKEHANRKLFGNGYHENEYIFKHADGSLYYPDYPSKAFRKIILKTPELPQNITFHGLRKSCVSILVHQGMDVKSTQKWVGHADIDTTLRIYAKVKDKAAKKEVSDTMNNILPL